MQYWGNAVMPTVLVVLVLLLAAEAVRRVFPGLARMGMPACIIAGVLGLGLGPDVGNVLPVDRETLETIVYHALAVVFIAIGLQAPQRSKGRVGAGTRSFMFAIPTMQSIQLVIGLGTLLVLSAVIGRDLHPGIGVMLPLGYEMGPGQALSLGAAWEGVGMTDGAQIGLIVAAAGFGWSIVVGVPLVLWGRARGLVSGARGEASKDEAEPEQIPVLPAGALELATRQVVAIAGCYVITYGLCWVLYRALSFVPEIAVAIWGYHFIVGTVVAMVVRPLLARLPGGTPLHDALLGRISGMTVDVMTCAALAAVQIAVLRANWLPIMLVTTLGGLVTVAVAVWFASRAFPDAPFEHCVVWFGMSTGTVPLGLALLRIVDPDLRSPAPITAVLGSAGSIPFSIPTMLVLIPGVVATWGTNYPLGGWIGLAIAAGYLVVMLICWRLFAPLRFRGPLHRIWVPIEEEESASVDAPTA
jgi:ESS family glutamate:Na+ symporter